MIKIIFLNIFLSFCKINVTNFVSTFVKLLDEIHEAFHDYCKDLN